MSLVTEKPVLTEPVSVEAGALLPARLGKARPLLERETLLRSLRESFRKLNPGVLMKNPVIFVVEVCALVTSLLLVVDVFRGGAALLFTFQITLWLWFTVLFANFAEAMAEARGKAQADALRASRQETRAKRLKQPGNHLDFLSVFATDLRSGDLVLVKAGDLIPADGEV